MSLEPNLKAIICTKCVMDTTDPLIHFDDQGVCNYCKLQAMLEERYALNDKCRLGIIDPYMV